MNFDEYRLLIEPPEFGFSPTQTIAASAAWALNGEAPPAGRIEHATPAEVPSGRDSVEFLSDGVMVRETLVEVETSVGRLVGVLTEPAEKAQAPASCLIVANAASLRRTGPNRMTVDIARTAAAGGMTTARFDFPGLGDSDGRLIRNFERRPEDDQISLVAIRAVADELQLRGIGDRFVAAGHCFGGTVALRAVVIDERFTGAIATNGGFASTEADRRRQLVGAKQHAGAMLRQHGEDGGQPGHRLAAWKGRLGDGLADLVLRIWEPLKPVDAIWRIVYRDQIRASLKAIDEIGASGADVVMLVSASEGLNRLVAQRKVAAKLRRWPKFTFEPLPGNDHLVRSLRAQDEALAQFLAALRGIAR